MTRSIDRRVFLTGVVGSAAALGLSACGAPALVVPEHAATGTARSGATMRIARPAASAAELLDPASSLSAYEYLGALYNRVVRLDRNGETVPDLATDWSSNGDATVWTFRLRPGVKFHDGRPLTSRDVRYTFEHILDPDTASPQAGPLSLIESMDAVDATTIRFHLSIPNAEFPSLLTAYQCYVICEGSAGTVGRSGIGTGPFVLESFVPAGAGVVRANEDYFDGRAVLDGIEFYSIQDTSARVNALLAHQVDLLSQTNLDNPTCRVVASSPGTTIARVENAQWYTIPMLCTSEEFSDPQVRAAMKLAYDPGVVLGTALQGEGTAGWDNPVPPQLAAFLDYEREYDPDKARSILKSIGKEDFRARLHTSAYDPNFTPIATSFVQQVKQAGIDLTITNVSADSYFTQVWMNEPLMVGYWATGRPIDQLMRRSSMSTNDPTSTTKAAMFIAPLVGIPVLIGVGLLLQSRGPGNMGYGFLTGAGIAVVLAAIMGWRVMRHPERATTFERGWTQAGDERDDSVLTRALAVLGLASLPMTGVAAITVGFGVNPAAAFTVLVFSLAVVLAISFGVINHRS